MKRAQKYLAVEGPHEGLIVTAVFKLFCRGCGLCPECYGIEKKYELYKRGELIRSMICESEIKWNFVPLDDYYTEEDLFATCLEYGITLKR